MIPGSPVDRNPDKPLDREILKTIEKRYHLHDRGAFVYHYIKNVVTEGYFGPSLQYQDQTVGTLDPLLTEPVRNGDDNVLRRFGKLIFRLRARRNRKGAGDERLCPTCLIRHLESHDKRSVRA